MQPPKASPLAQEVVRWALASYANYCSINKFNIHNSKSHEQGVTTDTVKASKVSTLDQMTSTFHGLSFICLSWF